MGLLIRVINRTSFSLEKEDMHLAFHSVLIICIKIG